jgi:ABC-type transport system substrate-binding protein
MKANRGFLILGVCALVLLSGVCATNMFAANEVTITGTVYAAAWDDNENVTAATIVAWMGEEYAIVNNAIGQQLFKLDSKDVKATGVVGEDSEGNKTITVTKYETVTE